MENEFIQFFLEVLLPILILGLILFLLLFGACFVWAGKEAKVYNKIHGTDWTASDFFWASNQINSQVQIIKLEGVTN